VVQEIKTFRFKCFTIVLPDGSILPHKEGLPGVPYLRFEREAAENQAENEQAGSKVIEVECELKVTHANQD
jgi:hypothetical protein